MFNNHPSLQIELESSNNPLYKNKEFEHEHTTRSYNIKNNYDSTRLFKTQKSKEDCRTTFNQISLDNPSTEKGIAKSLLIPKYQFSNIRKSENTIQENQNRNIYSFKLQNLQVLFKLRRQKLQNQKQQFQNKIQFYLEMKVQIHNFKIINLLILQIPQKKIISSYISFVNNFNKKLSDMKYPSITKNEMNQLITEHSKISQKYSDISKQNQEKELQISNLKNKLHHFDHFAKLQRSSEKSLSEKVNQMQAEFADIANRFHQKEKKCIELEIKIREISNELSNSNEMNEHLIQNLKEKIVGMERECQRKEEIIINLQNLSKKKSQDEKQIRGSFIEQRQPIIVSRNSIIELDDEELDNQLYPTQQQKQKFIPIVRKDEIFEIAVEIKYKMKQNNIKLENIDQFLFNDDIIKESITLSQLEIQLQKSPFLLNESDSVMLARYLVEDNEQLKITFDPNQSSAVQKVKSIFKNLMGGNNYKILTQIQLNEQLSEIDKVLKKYKMEIDEEVQRTKKNNKKVDTKKDWEKIIQTCELPLSFYQIDVLFEKIFYQLGQLKIIKDLELII